MKVIQIVPDIENESAGPAYSVPETAAALARCGVETELFALGRKNPNREYGCPVYTFPRHIKFIDNSPEMLAALKDRAKTFDILHTNSIWKMPNVYQYWAAKGTKCKTVIGPRGTVSAWALNRSKLKKFLFGHLFQYPAMRHADMFVASCQEEADDLRKMGFKQPIAIVTNGIDVPKQIAAPKASRRRMYFLSRIHPKKNLEMLIRAWARLEPEFQDWDLSIVGPDKNNPYADKIKQLASSLGCGRVKFEGEINGEAKQRFIAESECQVLPTLSENFGMVVAESLAQGTPVICTHGAPWGGLIDNKCGWWVPIAEDALYEAMREAMSSSREDLIKMGLAGREWMIRDFSWDGIGTKLKAAYEWLINGGEVPACVQL